VRSYAEADEECVILSMSDLRVRLLAVPGLGQHTFTTDDRDRGIPGTRWPGLPEAHRSPRAQTAEWFAQWALCLAPRMARFVCCE